MYSLYKKQQKTRIIQKEKTSMKFKEFQIYHDSNLNKNKILNQNWSIFSEKVKCCQLNDIDKGIKYVNQYYHYNSLLNNLEIPKINLIIQRSSLDDSSKLGNNSNESNNYNFNPESLSLVVRSKCCNIENIVIDSTNFLFRLNNNNQMRTDVIPLGYDTNIIEEVENLQLYREEFPQIINDEILNFFLNDYNFELDYSYMDLITRSQLYSQQLNNLITSNFNEGAENDFNYIVRNNNLERNPLNILNFNIFEYINIHETQYINGQISKIKNGSISKNQILMQLNENELNRLSNSQDTINSSIFLRVNFRNNRVAMFI